MCTVFLCKDHCILWCCEHFSLSLVAQIFSRVRVWVKISVEASLYWTDSGISICLGHRSPPPWSHVHLMNSVVAIVWVWMLFSKFSIPHFKRDWGQSVPCEAGRVAVVHVVFENAIQENFCNWWTSSGASSTDFILVENSLVPVDLCSNWRIHS